MADLTGIDLTRVRELEETENARFIAERARSMALRERARRSMPRGVPMAWMNDLDVLTEEASNTPPRLESGLQPA